MKSSTYKTLKYMYFCGRNYNWFHTPTQNQKKISILHQCIHNFCIQPTTSKLPLFCWASFSKKSCFITVRTLPREKPFRLHIGCKLLHKLFCPFFVGTGSLTMPLRPTGLPSLVLGDSSIKSQYSFLAFSQIAVSLMVSPSSCMSVFHTIKLRSHCDD